MSLPVRAADIVMGSTGFFQCITLNSRDMEREYARYPAPYRARMKHVPHGFDDKSHSLPKDVARQQFKLPVKFLGVGEQASDLARFQPHEFVQALFADLEPAGASN